MSKVGDLLQFEQVMRLAAAYGEVPTFDGELIEPVFSPRDGLVKWTGDYGDCGPASDFEKWVWRLGWEAYQERGKGIDTSSMDLDEDVNPNEVARVLDEYLERVGRHPNRGIEPQNLCDLIRPSDLAMGLIRNAGLMDALRFLIAAKEEYDKR